VNPSPWVRHAGNILTLLSLDLIPASRVGTGD
jgi:hypothetical protein